MSTAFIDKVKAAQKSLTDKANKVKPQARPKVRYLKTKIGKNRLRFMPAWTTEGVNANQFWREIYVHSNVGPMDGSSPPVINVLDPVKTPGGPGGVNPINEYIKQLWATKDPVNAEFAKKLRSKEKYLFNVVNLDDPTFTGNDVTQWKNDYPTVECPFKEGDTKVYLWEAGKTVFSQLISWMDDTEKDLSSLENGHNVVVNRVGSGEQDTKYTVTVMPDAKPFKFIGDIKTNIYNLDTVKGFVDSDTMKRMLTEGRGAFIKREEQASQLVENNLPKLTKAPVNTDDDEMDDLDNQLASLGL